MEKKRAENPHEMFFPSPPRTGIFCDNQTDVQLNFFDEHVEVGA
jgi:hypothetical protein